jgi:hypothetical protein
MSRNRRVHLFDEHGKPIGHARLRSDASPETVAMIKELARICVEGLRAEGDHFVERLRSERPKEPAV